MQVLLPFALVSKLKWFVIPTSFLSSIVYFTIDDCAAEMETPFGEDENVRAAEPREGRTRSLHLPPPRSLMVHSKFAGRASGSAAAAWGSTDAVATAHGRRLQVSLIIAAIMAIVKE